MNQEEISQQEAIPEATGVDELRRTTSGRLGRLLRRCQVAVDLAVESLCIRDPRSTRYTGSTLPPRDKCLCDNCFNQRSELAEAALRMLDP